MYQKITYYSRISQTLHVPVPAAAPAGYQGPGDIVTAAAWWGLRGYNAAFTGAAIDVVKTADGTNPQTFDILASGNIDITGLQTYIAANGGASVTKLYDQTGNSIHLVQTTLAAMPTITVNTTGLAASRASITFTAANSQLFTTTGNGGTQVGPALTNPCTISFVANTTGRTGASQRFISVGGVGNNPEVGYDDGGATPNQWFSYVRVTDQINAAVTDGTFYSAQSIYDGAGSNLCINGTDNNGTLETPNSTNEVIRIGTDISTTRFLQGNICELGIFSGNFSTTKAAMTSQQRTFWGI